LVARLGERLAQELFQAGCETVGLLDDGADLPGGELDIEGVISSASLEP